MNYSVISWLKKQAKFGLLDLCVTLPGRKRKAKQETLEQSWTDQMSQLSCLRAAAAIHHHAGNLSVDDLLLVVKIEHIYGWHFGGRTARAGRASRISVLHQMGVWVLLHEHVLTLAWTVVGLVALRSDDPIPSECLKVHCEWVAAAARFSWVLVAVQAKITTRTLCRLENLHLQERLLEIRGREVRGGKNEGRERWNSETENCWNLSVCLRTLTPRNIWQGSCFTLTPAIRNYTDQPKRAGKVWPGAIY